MLHAAILRHDTVRRDFQRVRMQRRVLMIFIRQPLVSPSNGQTRNQEKYDAFSKASRRNIPAAVTLHSGQLVAQSEKSVVMMLACVNEWWNFVYTTPAQRAR